MPATAPARTLSDALELLEPTPLDFVDENARSVAEDPQLYAERPRETQEALLHPSPKERLEQLLISGSNNKKLFLSGHVGSGKSTELSRLATSATLLQHFTVYHFAFEEQEWPTLDGPQVLFRLAHAIFEFGNEQQLVTDSATWRSHLRSLSQQLYGPDGTHLEGANVGGELNFLFGKIKTDLRLSKSKRARFREVAETEQTILQDLIRALIDDVETELARRQEPAQLLILVDDLDKVRDQELQREIFELNLNALLAPPVRVVYTLPSGVFFGGSREELRRNVVHLYPVRILEKAPSCYDPPDALLEDQVGFFLEIARKRVGAEVIDEAAIRVAAAASGGVLRTFFTILKDAVLLAQYNELDAVDEVTTREAVRDMRRNESAALYEQDLRALAHVHSTNSLRSSEDRRYLDLSQILECYNDSVWFEAHPLLWPLLEGVTRDAPTRSE